MKTLNQNKMTEEKEPTVQADELEFMYYKRGTAGSFRTGLYDLYWKANFINQIKLESVFPELWVLRQYTHTPSYWADLQARVETISQKK